MHGDDWPLVKQEPIGILNHINVAGTFRMGVVSNLLQQRPILQVPYRNLFRSDLSTLGSAIIAGQAAGLFNDLNSTAKQFAESNIEVHPSPDEDRKYVKYIKVYKELFEALKEIYKKLSE